MTLKQYLYLIVFLVFGSVSMQAQDTIQLHSVITGKLTVVAKKQVVLTSGFTAIEGSNVLIYTDENQDESTVVCAPTKIAVDDQIIPKSSVSSDQNYVCAITMFEANSSTSLSDDDLAKIKHAEDIQYYDGLGRLRQTIQVAASPNGYDIIQPTVYDSYGSETLKYLPYVGASSQGAFQEEDEDACIEYYGTATIQGRKTDTKPYSSITEYDNSPLHRVFEQYGIGYSWYNDKEAVEKSYTTNTCTIKNWNEEGVSVDDYAIGTLYVTSVMDEDFHITREYKDKQERVVLKERGIRSSDKTLKTYYVYDDFGLLRIVIPPLANGQYNDLCYTYTYDKRHRMITKKIPGAEKVYMVYDSKDRLVLTQDGNMRKENSSEYLFTKYDELNRPVMTGKVYFKDKDINEIREDAEKASSSETFNSDNSCYGYTTKGSYPEIDMGNVLTVTWYDNYKYLDLKSPENISNCSYDNYSTQDDSYGSEASTKIKGLVTGSLVKVLPLSTDADYDVVDTVPVTATYYDSLGNVIRIVASNFRGGYDITLTNYEDITYRVQSYCEVHKSKNEDTTPLAITKKYSYDHMGRLLQTTSQVDDGTAETGEEEIVLNAMQYNELGELVSKYLYGENTDLNTDNREFAQRVDYGYNIRGWLTSINDPSLNEDNDVFGLKLYYVDADDVSGTATYNGNIAAMSWAVDTTGYKAVSPVIKGYMFGYDSFNRLKAADYGETEDLSENLGLYDVSIPSYDDNGNILSLQRYHNGTIIDNLTYKYNDYSNQLQSVSDNAVIHEEDVADFEDVSENDSYDYDSNGNMKYDASRGNDITYNILNLPKLVAITGKEDYGIYYLYDAAGSKLAKIVRDGKDADKQVTEYLGNLVYKDYDLSFIQTDEGRLMKLEEENEENVSENYWHYEYNLKDHLGNTRFVFGGSLNSGRVEVLQAASYYPFGMIMDSKDFSSATINYRKNKYLYNGKEYQDDDLDGNSLNLYDYGARFYDPAIARWTTQDPMAEFHFESTPYHYCFNNPIRFIDAFGMDTTATGEQIGADGLTNYQWLEASRPGADPSLAKYYRQSNRQFTINQSLQNDDFMSFIMGNTSGYYTTVDDQIQKWYINSITNDASYTSQYEEDENEDVNVMDVVEHTIGPAMIGLGANILSTRGKFKGATKGTSIASKWLSHKLPQKMGFRFLGTNVLGRMLGRAVPYVGWGLTINDINNLLRDYFPSYDQFLIDQDKINKEYGGPNMGGKAGMYVCFVAGTKVYTEDGLVNIEDLKEGIKVYSYNIQTNEVELNSIVKFFKRKTNEIYSIFVGRQKILVTAEHPFYVKDKGWVKVKNLKEGDLLFTSKERIKKITGISKENRNIFVYNIEVSGNHNYFVSGVKVLVHNK